MSVQPDQKPPFYGLKNSEVPALLKQFGKNSFQQKTRSGFLNSVKNLIQEPMFLMLVLASALYFILGEFREGWLMLLAMVFVTTIAVYQETRNSHAIEALKELTQAKVRVVREQNEQIIITEDLLPGDIIILAEGDRVPADAVILHANDLTVNESAITGESVPVEKNANINVNKLYQGTMIDSGSCYSEVLLTGKRTVLGKIGQSVNELNPAKTPLQEQIGRFVKGLAAFGLFAFALIWLINYIHSGDIINSLLLGLTLAMSAIPEEIPVAFSTFMALGSAKMAGLGIIARESKTIENLGAVSVICLDKTGTITKNRMEVKEISGEDLDRTLLIARMASEKNPFDAMEKAIVEAFKKLHKTEEFEKMRVIHEYPLDGRPPMMTHVYETCNGMVVAGKGAPERILRVCRVHGEDLQKLENKISEMAALGFRVLGVCSAENLLLPFPKMQDDFNWKFEGFLSLYDPPKEKLEQVFQKWYQAGIVIKLITGDYPSTAMHIAAMTGIQTGTEYLTGEQVMSIPKEDLQHRVGDIQVYARMFPEAKLKVVRALKANHQIVAMTGDGVNDAPALKAADIGIAMGNKGTEVAKEASNLVITDDDLDKITQSIAEGRKIYANFKKAVRYIISIHIPIILTASLPVILGWRYPNVFMPIHIIFLELIMGPTCSVFFEREPLERDIMRDKPRPFRINIFSGRELRMSILQGVVISLGLLLLYFYFMQRGYELKYVRTIVFNTLILSNIFLTFSNRSFRESLRKTLHYKNSLAPWLLCISIGFLLVINVIPFVRKIFALETLNTMHYFLCLGSSLLAVGWFEIYKTMYRNRKRHGYF